MVIATRVTGIFHFRRLQRMVSVSTPARIESDIDLAAKGLAESIAYAKSKAPAPAPAPVTTDQSAVNTDEDSDEGEDRRKKTKARSKVKKAKKNIVKAQKQKSSKKLGRKVATAKLRTANQNKLPWR